MKKWKVCFVACMVFISAMLIMLSCVHATPFLVCDPAPVSQGDWLQPTDYVLQQCVDKACTQLLGPEITSPAVPYPNSVAGEVWMHYDLAAMPIGKFYFRIKAVYAMEVWGVYRDTGWVFFDSERPDPLAVQQKQVVPLSNIRLSSQ